MTMKVLRELMPMLALCFSTWFKYSSEWVQWVFAVLRSWFAPGGQWSDQSDNGASQPWQTDIASRTYSCGGAAAVTVQTSTHAFQVDLGKLSEGSEYFRALSQSNMRETTESLIHLEHVPSTVFHNLLEYTFLRHFSVPEGELGTHIEVGGYLLAHAFVSECLTALSRVLTPENCEAYLAFAQEICSAEMLETVYRYLSRNLLELPLTRALDAGEKEMLIRLRSGGSCQLCVLRKENLTSESHPETEPARHLYSLVGSEDDGDWCRVTALPFAADKWCFTTAVLHNYLYLIGGYRHRARRGYEFKMASFRFNPFTNTWASTTPLIKHRRHFSAAVCEGSIFAVGGWYLDSLVTPDSSTVLYTAVERYDPWSDTWAFVSSLPLTDFLFTMSLSHDIPLAATLGHCIYVIGTIQRTGEKLVLQYDVRKDSWSELLPTLTRANAEIPSLYFLGATDRLYLIGGTNTENVVTSFCVESQQWGRVRAAEKMALVGQGTVFNSEVYMPAIEHNSIARINLQSLSVHHLPPLPVSTSYEALFHLHF